MAQIVRPSRRPDLLASEAIELSPSSSSSDRADELRAAAESLCAAARVLVRNARAEDLARHMMLVKQVEAAAERIRLALDAEPAAS